MTDTDVLIVGAGPAGAACAGELQRRGGDFLLLDKAVFPRDKTCAGWLTPEVFRNLGLTPADYPYGLKTFRRFVIHFRRRRVILPVEQYAIRRIEFDRFLLEHFHLHPLQHTVKEIRKEGGHFIIDHRFRARRLVGAGGSYCRVADRFFPERKTQKERWISAVEAEFRYDVRDDRCHLWFGLRDLPGYAWYVPKADGYLNIGIGGYTQRMKERGTNIHEQWEDFLQILQKERLLTGEPPRGKGYTYMIRRKDPPMERVGVMILGDAAGLATPDMGEGIGPAIDSGLLAAESLATGKPLSARSIRRHSFNHPKTLLQMGWRYLLSGF
jgi:geranylgeranyl reductase family protein